MADSNKQTVNRVVQQVLEAAAGKMEELKRNLKPNEIKKEQASFVSKVKRETKAVVSSTGQHSTGEWANMVCGRLGIESLTNQQARESEGRG